MIAIKISNAPKPTINAAREPNRRRLWTEDATGELGLLSLICLPSVAGETPALVQRLNLSRGYDVCDRKLSSQPSQRAA